MNFLPILTTVLEAEPNRYGGTGSPDLTQYGILIASLLAAVAFLAWAFKRFIGGNMIRKADERALQVCDVLPLGGKQKMAVIRCYDRSFFLGISDHQIDLIAELDANAIGANDKPMPLAAKHKDAFLRALQKVQAVAPAPEPQRTVQPAPAPPEKTVRRKPVQPAAQPAARTRTAQPAKRVAKRRVDDGRGMLA